MMEPLVAAAGFERVLGILAVLGPVFGIVYWLVSRKQHKSHIKSVCIGMIPVTVYTLWLVERWSIRVFGLDSVLGLGIMVVIFCAVGVASAALITAISRRDK